MSYNGDEFRMLHAPQWCLVAFEWVVHQNVVIRNLVAYLAPGQKRYLRTNLSFLRQKLHEDPGLIPSPRQTLRVLRIIPESILPQLAHAAGDDVFNSVFNFLATSDLVNELRGELD